MWLPLFSYRPLDAKLHVVFFQVDAGILLIFFRHWLDFDGSEGEELVVLHLSIIGKDRVTEVAIAFDGFDSDETGTFVH